jgi:hypothetical protein
MDIKILDNKPGWILGKVSLLEYIKSLTEENFRYEIQRGIVSNPFLDTILDAVVENKPLAPVSLVSKDFEDGDKTLSINQFNILDGLQRTFRFWIYYQLAKLAKEKNSNDYRLVTKEFKTICDDYSLAVSPRQVRGLFKHDNAINVWNLNELYSNFDLYLYIWTDLSVDQEIKQMLILNAGQKQMSLNHQFELIYMRLFEENTFDEGKIKILRSKDGKITNRNIGEYSMSTVIIGVQSLVNMKPMRLSRDMLYKDDFQNDMLLSSMDGVFTIGFVRKFLDMFNILDKKISVNQEYSNWFAKDTTISGMMAGIGQHIQALNHDSSYVLANLSQSVESIVGAEAFRLDEYNKVYSELSGAKVNIGKVLRRAVMIYTQNVLDGTAMSWKEAFNQAIMK